MKPATSKLSKQDIALSDAARDGDVRAVQQLLAAGIGPDVKDDRFSLGDVTPLMRASRRGHLQVVELLLKAGAKVKARDKHISSSEADGHTPLHYAAKQRHLEVARELLKAGADINAVGRRYLGTPLCEAMIGDSEIQPSVKEFLKGVKQKPATDDEQKAILAFAKFLLAEGADPNIEAKVNRSVPLDDAALRGLNEVVGVLLDAGADPNHRDAIGATAFASALNKGHAEVAIRLLKRGLKVDLADRNGWTHLHWAVACGYPEVVRATLKAGADVNCKSDKGKTPLDLAVERERSDIEQILRKLV
jgi:ankyrin repeat protein